MADALREILNWSQNQPSWQRDGLRRLFTTNDFSSADLDELLTICKAAHGLADPAPTIPLTEEHLAIAEESTGPIVLDSVTHHSGVNALAPEQTVRFGPQMTIVYGQNAAGKSGYTRILKRACRARHAEEILGNVLSDQAPLKANATIEYEAGGTKESISWSADTAVIPELAAVSVFDAQCAPVYLRDKTDVAFRPFSLDVFDKLASACGELKRRLEAELEELERTKPAMPSVREGTRTAALLANLTALTKPDDVRTLGALSETETARMTQLQHRRRDLQATDPKKQARELQLRANRADFVRKHVETLHAKLGHDGIQLLTDALSSLTSARAALDAIRQAILSSGLLPGTGQESWRKMWDAAAEFSGVAYPDSTFPLLTDGARCPLCQQELGPHGVSRFEHFRELVESTAQSDVRAAEGNYNARSSEIVGVVTIREDVTLALEEIAAADHAPLAETFQEYIREAEHVRAAIAVAPENPPKSWLQTPPTAALETLVSDLRERGSRLNTENAAMDPKEESELSELEARSTLAQHLDQVLGAIERKQRVAAFRQCINETGTASITRESTDLTKRLVTERLAGAFHDELRKLEFTHLAVALKPAKGTRGALLHQLVFTNAPGVAVARVLSEGESRALALAAFLAELTTATAPSAIIFDDPVSSMDHIWRERIASRLVDEARVRQVIVFTHDITFLRMLIDKGSRTGIKLEHQYVRRDGSVPGLSSQELPWVAMPLKDRIGRLRNMWQIAEKTYRRDGASAYERDGREIFGYLREAWEQAIEEVLLNSVVERFRPSIQTRRVRHLHDITSTDCQTVEDEMTECSRWIRGHDQPAADGSPFPDPAHLRQRIETLESWSLDIRKRR